MDHLLYGKKDLSRVVGLHPHGGDEMKVYRRSENDVVQSRTYEFQPFGHFTARGAEVLAEGYNPEDVVDLNGPGEYNRLVVFANSKQFWSAKGWLYGRDELERDDWYIEKSLPTQFLQWTGMTLFQDMTMDDIHRMQIDLEVISDSGMFPNAERPEDEIIIASVTDNRGLERIIHQSAEARSKEGYDPNTMRYATSEKGLLTELLKVVHRHDPDVLEFHNGFGFDLPYMFDRADMHELHLPLGRDKQEPTQFSSTKEFAERNQEFTNILLGGRSIMDSYFLAADFDVFARDLPSYGLKDLARYFGFESDDRTHVKGEKITQVWHENPMRLIDYALDDVRDTRTLVEKLGTSTFELTKILPATYQDVLTLGTAGSIEKLMAREYIRQGEAIPTPSEPDQPTGGYTNVFLRGSFRDLAYADVSSLYPSNMLLYGVNPDGDSLNIFRPLLDKLTSMRLKTKKRMRELDEGDLKDTLDAKQQAYKVLINSFYGALAFQYFPWNDFEDAALVTRKGRKILKRLVHEIKTRGGRPILCDTDGVMFELPRSGMTDEEVDKFIGETISEAMPPGIDIDNDGRFAAVASYKPKNYAKVPRGYTSKLKLAGNSLTGRGIEPVFLDYIRHQMWAVINRDPERMYEIHHRLKSAIWSGDLTAEDIKKRGRLKKTMDEYADSPAKQARYEVAKDWAERTGKEPKAGDTHWYYVKGTEKKYKVYQSATLIEDYDDDENPFHYHKRLDAVADMFRKMVTDPERVFSMTKEDPNQSSLFSQEPDLSDVDIVEERLSELPRNPSDSEIEPTHHI